MKYTKEQVIEQYDTNPSDIQFTGFWGARGDTTPERVFSNFHPTKFIAFVYGDLISEFKFSEQYFMYRKAVEFKDFETADKIINEEMTAQGYKQLGREVQNFDQEHWDSVKYDIMIDSVYSKFSQNKELKDTLIATGDSVLVECSPYDDIWGIKLGQYDIFGNETDWKNPHSWNGENLLGFALMEVRDRLKEETEITFVQNTVDNVE